MADENAVKSGRVVRLLKIIIITVLAVLLIAGIYVAYVFIAYRRLDDNLNLEVGGSQTAQQRVDTQYRMISFNIGFGAYEPDYSFFMDGGTQSWAWSRDRLKANMEGIATFVGAQNADIINLQEVDEEATRTYSFNEREFLEERFSGYDNVFAQNWDSPFLFYPLTQPHGSSRSGIMTFSRYKIDSAVRRQFPVEDSVMKIVDLDRCYCKSYIEVEGGKTLALFNAHMSAYTSDGEVASEQLKMIVADMKEEYEKGNYVICGADFNKDLLGDSSEYFGVKGEDYSWAQPIDKSVLEGTGLSLIAATNAPSCRVADAPYSKEQFVLTLDGFIVSDNVEEVNEETIDTQFKYSDHNPVMMTFKLK